MVKIVVTESDARYAKKFVAWTAAALGFGALMFMLGSGVQRYNSANSRAGSYSPPATQTEIYRAEQMPSAPEIAINVEDFNRYQNQREGKYKELAGSRQVNMREVPIPYGVPFTEDEINRPQAFAFDINGDGIEEIYMQNGCGSGGCWGSIYQNTGSGYMEILDSLMDRISDRTTNGYPVVFDVRKFYLPAGGFTDVAFEYAWNGQKYVESDKFIASENLSDVAENIQMVFETEQDLKSRSEFLRQLEGSIGTYDAMRTFLQFQAPPGFTMPTGSEYIEYVREYAREVERTNPGMGERALTRYADDPSGFFAALYGRSLDPAFLNISDPMSLVAVSAQLALRHAGKSDFERHMDRWDRAQRNSGFLAAYKNATGNYPRTEEELWSAQNNVVREDQLRDTPGQRVPTTMSYDPLSGSSTESRQFSPGSVTGNPRYNTPYQPSQPRNFFDQQGRQNLNEFRQRAPQDLQRGVQQGAERGRQMLNQGINQLGNMLKPPPPKKPPQN